MVVPTITLILRPNGKDSEPGLSVLYMAKTITLILRPNGKINEKGLITTALPLGNRPLFFRLI